MMSDFTRHKRIARPPPRPRTCREFLDHWMPILARATRDVELDFSFTLDGVTATDMRVPSALRTGLIYTRQEIEDGVDMKTPGDLDRRIAVFMAKGAR